MRIPGREVQENRAKAKYDSPEFSKTGERFKKLLLLKTINFKEIIHRHTTLKLLETLAVGQRGKN